MTIVLWVLAIGGTVWLAHILIRRHQDAKLDKVLRYYRTMADACLGKDELRILNGELEELFSSVMQVEGLSTGDANRMAKRAAIQSIINHLRFCAAFPDPDNLAYVKPS
ncbi:hypothetical protein [Brevundimonas sp. A19_0]|uniref:hypothetical protein n=1 Tax=Brevundimonas sp. A19_0 TaxID=2821087 RepID=UPI001ADA411B|nr:hypothetical protein [Brevundimonas sp. A19_0]MBO9500667.1 hypothetical protein [Brevundimonas sp. A19_0]